jgi:hypothetical protein
MTPLSVNEGWIVSGYVMTGAFWEECTRDDARGDAARVTLATAKRNVTKAAPPRIVRPATIAEIPVPFPGSL